MQIRRRLTTNGAIETEAREGAAGPWRPSDPKAALGCEPAFSRPSG